MSNWKKYWLNPWMGGAVLFLFGGVICLIQTQQYVAEKTGEGLWWLLGGVLVIIGVICFIKMVNTSGGNTGYK